METGSDLESVPISAESMAEILMASVVSSTSSIVKTDAHARPIPSKIRKQEVKVSSAVSSSVPVSVVSNSGISQLATQPAQAVQSSPPMIVVLMQLPNGQTIPVQIPVSNIASSQPLQNLTAQSQNTPMILHQFNPVMAATASNIGPQIVTNGNTQAAKFPILPNAGMSSTSNGGSVFITLPTTSTVAASPVGFSLQHCHTGGQILPNLGSQHQVMILPTSSVVSSMQNIAPVASVSSTYQTAGSSGTTFSGSQSYTKEVTVGATFRLDNTKEENKTCSAFLNKMSSFDYEEKLEHEHQALKRQPSQLEDDDKDLQEDRLQKVSSSESDSSGDSRSRSKTRKQFIDSHDHQKMHKKKSKKKHSRADSLSSIDRSSEPEQKRREHLSPLKFKNKKPLVSDAIQGFHSDDESDATPQPKKTKLTMPSRLPSLGTKVSTLPPRIRSTTSWSLSSGEGRRGEKIKAKSLVFSVKKKEVGRRASPEFERESRFEKVRGSQRQTKSRSPSFEKSAFSPDDKKARKAEPKKKKKEAETLDKSKNTSLDRSRGYESRDRELSPVSDFRSNSPMKKKKKDKKNKDKMKDRATSPLREDVVIPKKKKDQMKARDKFMSSVPMKSLEKRNLDQSHDHRELATALTMGQQHNVVLQEKHKPKTFVDKVRLMRQVRPSMPLSRADMKAWKGQLCSKFQVKDVRRFQQSYGIHLKMAQLEQNVWAMVEDVSESVVNITEKFFRPLMKLTDDEIKTCLEILKSQGLAEYNKKVKEFSDASLKKRKIEDTCEMEEQNGNEDLLAENLRASQDRCSKLRNELAKGLVSQAHNVQGHSSATNTPVTNMAMPNIMGNSNGVPSHFGNNNSFGLGNNGSSGGDSSNIDLDPIMKNIEDFSQELGNLAKMGNNDMSQGVMGSNYGTSLVNGNADVMGMGNMALNGAMGINGSFNSMHGNANMKMDTGQNMVARGASNLHNLSASLSGSNGSLSGFTGLQGLGNSLDATTMSPSLTNGNSGLDALSQAYTGFHQYAGLSDLLSPATVNTSLLSLSPQPMQVTLELLVSVDLPKTGDDEKEPLLTGLDFLPDGRLVAVDNKNKKCIILNDRLQRLGTPYKFKYSPFGVVCVSHDTLCVTFGGDKVVRLLSVSTDNTITLTREITTSSKFDSICCMSPSNMVVSTYDDPRPLRMISVGGVESDFDHSLTLPMKTYRIDEIACTYVQSKNTLVLTDRFANNVFMYDTVNGTSRAVTNENIQQPRGACVGPGDTVLVCSERKDSIVHLTINGKIVGTYPVDMKYPYSICMSKDGNKLVVSNCAIGVGKLHLYKISPAMS
ncbi:uncharacterized protein LOC127868277 isoform X2 [Dreissena polymorpha]|uniref:uncharacterized protein LOC127868277 isoform X2 n=1 Tax=Dreissena polymorpha TaxID=45954 RepID=UPI00226553A3|nr:uncharacterized protein LOC127868277 isoform X2 [Dreissena polymorpha]